MLSEKTRAFTSSLFCILMLFSVLSAPPVEAQSDPIANPPLTIAMTDIQANYPRNREITPVTPVTTGGSGNTFSISPSLPAGLLFDTSTGTCVDAPCLASIIFDFRRGLRSDVCQASRCGLL
jgi:hypothetical protein